MWILVVVLVFGGFASGVNIDDVQGFETKESCEQAAQFIKDSSSGKSVKTLCLETR